MIVMLQRNLLVSCNTTDHLVQRLCESHQAGFPNLHVWPHSQLFEDGPPLSSGHYVMVIQVHFYHLLPLFDLAPPSVSSSRTLGAV